MREIGTSNVVYLSRHEMLRELLDKIEIQRARVEYAASRRLIHRDARSRRRLEAEKKKLAELEDMAEGEEF